MCVCVCVCVTYSQWPYYIVYQASLDVQLLNKEHHMRLVTVNVLFCEYSEMSGFINVCHHGQIHIQAARSV